MKIGENRLSNFGKVAIAVFFLGMFVAILNYYGNDDIQLSPGIKVSRTALNADYQSKTFEGAVYTPTGINVQIKDKQFLHVVTVNNEGESMPVKSNLMQVIRDAKYYIRYSEEDVRTVNFNQVITALKNTNRPLMGLCGNKIAEEINGNLELRISDSKDPNKAVVGIIAGVNCPSKSKGFGDCWAQTDCDKIFGGKGTCAFYPWGCWCSDKPKDFNF